MENSRSAMCERLKTLWSKSDSVTQILAQMNQRQTFSCGPPNCSSLVRRGIFSSSSTRARFECCCKFVIWKGVPLLGDGNLEVTYLFIRLVQLRMFSCDRYCAVDEIGKSLGSPHRWKWMFWFHEQIITSKLFPQHRSRVSTSEANCDDGFMVC